MIYCKLIFFYFPIFEFISELQKVETDLSVTTQGIDCRNRKLQNKNFVRLKLVIYNNLRISSRFISWPTFSAFRTSYLKYYNNTNHGFKYLSIRPDSMIQLKCRSLKDIWLKPRFKDFKRSFKSVFLDFSCRKTQLNLQLRFLNRSFNRVVIHYILFLLE